MMIHLSRILGTRAFGMGRGDDERYKAEKM